MLTETEFDKLVPSPDGKSFAAIRNGESLIIGRFVGGKAEFSERAKDDVVDLCWHPHGKLLFYLTAKGQMKALQP